MKKIRALVIMLLLTAFLAVPVSAAAGKASITSPNVTAAQGETFTLTVNLSDADKIKIGTALLIYDTAAFEMLGGKCLVEGVSVGQVVKDQNVGTFLLMDAKKVSGDIFTFEMRVKENASAGDYIFQLKTSIGVDNGSYIDAVGTVVTVTETSSGTTPPPAPTEEKMPDPTTGTSGSDPIATQPVDTQPDTQQTPDVTVPEGTEDDLPADTATNAADSVVDNDTNSEEQQQTPTIPKTEFPWWIIAVLAAAAVVVAVLLLKKKKTEN